MLSTMCMLILAMYAVDIVDAMGYVYAVTSDAGMYIATCIHTLLHAVGFVFWHVHVLYVKASAMLWTMCMMWTMCML